MAKRHDLMNDKSPISMTRLSHKHTNIQVCLNMCSHPETQYEFQPYPCSLITLAQLSEVLGTEETLYSCWLVLPRLGIVRVILWLYLLGGDGHFKLAQSRLSITQQAHRILTNYGICFMTILKCGGQKFRLFLNNTLFQSVCIH